MLQPLKSYSDRLAERLSASQARPRRTVFKILHNPNTLKLSWFGSYTDRGEFVVAWEDTIRVEAFKRDLYAVDLICLALVLKNNKAVEIDEEMDGWESVVEKLPEYLSGCQRFEQWFTVVAFPAFNPNPTVIYRRDE